MIRPILVMKYARHWVSSETAPSMTALGIDTERFAVALRTVALDAECDTRALDAARAAITARLGPPPGSLS